MMGVACQVISGRVTNPGAVLTALTVGTGDSFTVANFNLASTAYLDEVWAKEATKGVLRIRSPRLHDAAQALRLNVGDTIARNLLPLQAGQPLYPGDLLTVELSGGAAETDMASLLLYYQDLPGIQAQLAHWEEVAPRIVNIAGIEVDPVTSATAGDWGAGRAINADFDVFKADARYALLGYDVDTSVCTFAISGPDTGNLKMGGPGPVDHIQTRNYFVDQALATGRPYIPVIAGNNRGATLAFVADPATAVTVKCTMLFAELRA